MKQVSVFAENKKGAIKEIFDLIAEAGVGVIASVTYDSAEFGMLRLIVTEPERAARVLSENGYLARITPVLGVRISDENGSLAKMLGILRDMNIDIEYSYLSFDRETSLPVMVFSCDAMDEVEESLTQRGMTVVG